MGVHYILDKDHNLIEVSVLEWAQWFGNIKNRRVARAEIGDDYVVSTVFLGIDHGFGGVPLYFETMVFPKGSHSDIDCDRYATWDQAVAGHERMVAKWLERNQDDEEEDA